MNIERACCWPENRFHTISQSPASCEIEKEEFVDREKTAQENLDLKIAEMHKLSRDFFKKIAIEQEGWKMAIQLSQEVHFLFDQIHIFLQTLSVENSQGPWQFWMHNLGLRLSPERKLVILSSKLNHSWNAFLKRCNQVAKEAFTQHEYFSALTIWLTLLKAEPQKNKYNEYVGDCYLKMGLQEQALGYYERWIVEEKHRSRLSLKKAELYLDSGAADLALQNLSDVQERSLQKLRHLLLIDAEIQSHNHLEAVTHAMHGIESYPEEDLFKLRLIDCYIARSQNDSKTLFRSNFFLLYQYFASQNCYLQIARQNRDVEQILFDLLEYASSRLISAQELYKEIILEMHLSDDFLAVLLDTFDNKIAHFERKNREFKKEYEKLETYIMQKESPDQNVVQWTRNLLLNLSKELCGGKKATIPVGFKLYLHFYQELVACLKQRYLKEEQRDVEVIHQLEQYLVRLEKVRSDIVKITAALFSHDGRSSPNKVSLRFEFEKQKRKAQLQESISDDEEISAIDWIKRGNLMNFLANSFVPSQLQNNLVEYLHTQGIETDALFASDLMKQVAEVPLGKSDEQAALQEFILAKQIFTLSDLREYLQGAPSRSIFGRESIEIRA